MIEKKDISICHGEPMIPTERRMENGRILVTYRCGFHNCSGRVDIPLEKNDLEMALERRLDDEGMKIKALTEALGKLKLEIAEHDRYIR